MNKAGGGLGFILPKRSFILSKEKHLSFTKSSYNNFLYIFTTCQQMWLQVYVWKRAILILKQSACLVVSWCAKVFVFLVIISNLWKISFIKLQCYILFYRNCRNPSGIVLHSFLLSFILLTLYDHQRRTRFWRFLRRGNW